MNGIDNPEEFFLSPGTHLKIARRNAVKKILMKKDLPPDMRVYWSMVIRRIDPWFIEKQGLRNMT
jgi:hypothetical protein|tara:strand:+ start:4513 stop:4707 length:195 start_codon:yes stop_codon:yes gene_type:complete